MTSFPSHCVFLPGFMCDHRLFRPQIEALQNAGVETIVGDLAQSETIDAMAHDVLAIAPERFALVGLSMGGIVALRIADLAPDRISHLALLNTTPLEDRVSDVRLQQLESVQRGEMETVLKDEMKPNYIFEDNITAELLDLVMDMGQSLGPEVFNRQTKALMHRRSQIDALTRITCPTLVLTGRHDQLCPPEIHQSMAARIKDAALVIVEKCGHLSTLEKPRQVCHALLSLFESSPGLRTTAPEALATHT